MSPYGSDISREILSNSVNFFTTKCISIQKENNTRIYLIPLLPGLNEIKSEVCFARACHRVRTQCKIAIISNGSSILK